MSNVRVICFNCGATHSGDFCADCGQRHGPQRVSFRSLGAELLSLVVELDHGVLHTFVDLLRSPGSMIREYNAGRRKSYTSPITYVLLSAAASLLLKDLTPMNKANFDEVFIKTPAWIARLYSPLQIAAYDQFRMLLATNKFAGLAAGVLPIMLMFRYLFRKRQVNLAEMGVLACYAIGEWTLVSVLVSLPFALAGQVTTGSIVLTTLFVPYLVWVGFGYFGRSYSTIWRVFAALAFTGIAIIAASLLEPLIIGR